jgi:transcription elongation factor SPT6
MFDTLNSMMRWFKEHFRDPVPGTPSTPRGSLTSRTPFTTQTPSMNMSSKLMTF